MSYENGVDTVAEQSVPVESTNASTVEAADPVPRRKLLVSGVLAGVLGAASLPITGVGIGWVVAALGVLAVIAFARYGVRHAVSSDAGPAGRESTVVTAGDRAWRWASAVAALLLVAMAGIRGAGWLVASCLVVSVLLASYALAGGRNGLDVLRGFFALVAAAAPSPNRPVASPRPDRPRRIGSVVGGVTGGVILLLLFGTLFRAADPAFDDLIEQWRRDLFGWSVWRAVLGFGAAGGLAFAGVRLLRRRMPISASLRDIEVRDPGPAVWAIPLGMLDALFGVFVWVQITVLFAGDEYVLGPGGPDYAVYARGGSIQLAVVAILTLGVLGSIALWIRPRSREQRIALRVLGGVLCGLTLVVVASALTRLSLYADAYGFTRPRLLGFAGIAWLGLVFLLLAGAGVRLRAAWFPRAVCATAVGVLLALVAVNPEQQMARTHIDRLTADYPLDSWFLSHLSVDAIDAIDGLPESQRACALRLLAADLSQPDAWYEWNLARAHARTVLAARPPTATCVWIPAKPRS